MEWVFSTFSFISIVCFFHVVDVSNMMNVITEKAWLVRQAEVDDISNMMYVIT